MRLPASSVVLLVAFSALTASATIPTPIAPVSQPPRQITGAAAPLDAVSITLVVNLKLSKLSPLAATASLRCSAIAGTMDTLSMYASEFQSSWIMSNPILANGHYYGAEAQTPKLPIVNGSYQGTQTVVLKIGRNGLIDSKTHALYTNPGVAAACALYIGDFMAKYDPATQLPNETNANVVSTDHPWIVVTQALQNLQ